MMRRILLSVFLAILVVGAVLMGCGEPPGRREMEKGVRELQRGNYVRAKALLEKSITRRPGSEENARTYNYLGLACWHLDQVEAAVDAFEDSRRLNPDLVAPTYNLGVLMYKAGDLFRATVLLEEAALVDVNDARPLEFLGHIYRQSGDWAKARRALYAALERAPQSPRVLTALALVELYAAGPHEAVRYLMEALEKNPQYAPALYNLAVIHATRLGHPDQAKAFYREFLRLNPNGPQAEAARLALESETAAGVPLGAPAPATSVAAAPTAAAPKVPREEPPKPAAARAPEPSAAAAKTALPEAAAEAVKTLVAQGREEAARGRTSQALNLFLQAAARAQRDNDAGRREEVLKLAVELCFDQARAHYAYGRFLAEQGRHKAALVSFKQAVVLHPDWPAAHEALADAAAEEGEFDAALVALRKAVALDRQNAEALWKLARMYDEKLESAERAVAAYREFRKLFPGDPRVLEAEKRIEALQPAAPAAREEPATREEPVQVEAPAPRAPPRAPAAPATEERPPQQLVRQAAAAASGYARRLNIPKPAVRNMRAAVEAYNRGTLHQSRQDWDRAAYYYRRALESDDTFVDAFYNLGTVYRARGDLDLAKDAYLHAITLRPDKVNARYNLALVYWDLRECTAAQEAAESVLALDPNHAGAHYLLGLIFSLEPQTYPRAKEHYQRFVDLAPNDRATPRVREWLAAH